MTQPKLHVVNDLMFALLADNFREAGRMAGAVQIFWTLQEKRRETQFVNRCFNNTHRATTPSFQPIFLPSS
jgi:hypothetical protein